MKIPVIQPVVMVMRMPSPWPEDYEAHLTMSSRVEDNMNRLDDLHYTAEDIERIDRENGEAVGHGEGVEPQPKVSSRERVGVAVAEPRGDLRRAARRRRAYYEADRPRRRGPGGCQQKARATRQRRSCRARACQP